MPTPLIPFGPLWPLGGGVGARTVSVQAVVADALLQEALDAPVLDRSLVRGMSSTATIGLSHRNTRHTVSVVDSPTMSDVWSHQVRMLGFYTKTATIPGDAVPTVPRTVKKLLTQ